jgi:hypothetical protein
MAKKEKAQYLVMADDDMIFPPNTIERLLESEKAMGDCVYSGFAAVGSNPCYPAFWVEGDDGRGLILWDYPRDKRFTVDFVGGYFFLVPPSILYSDKMPENPFECRDGMSEDHSFSKNVREAGFSIVIDPTLVIGHLRLRPITDKDWDIHKLDLDPNDYFVYSASSEDR